jgi:hypothetical protein
MFQHAAASLFSSKHPDLWPASKCSQAEWQFFLTKADWILKND